MMFQFLTFLVHPISFNHQFRWKELLAVKSQGQKNLCLLRLLALCRFLNCSFPHFGQLHLKALPACDPVSEHMFAQKLLSKDLI